ncbi:2OG-Fe(II) oxygenase [Sphingomonas sp. RHCKR7]|uniref:cyclophane-containing peptide 2OG-Fe(II) oxygenase YhhC n=1 Tax=Sphingomonas folli TaxID=2862497 RepID=UPI001CA571F5|nr:cyclophane-containing peptide 2OG-Fe(II) oxygenase YhhC [Sphingomonas folli]MBW6525235.1 2OG-Fe(II) oxygenase [Sphingomonas folli]
MLPDFTRSDRKATPFPHFITSGLLPGDVADALLRWLEEDAPWQLRIADFYEQNEFSLLAVTPPPAAGVVIAPEFIEAVAAELSSRLSSGSLELVDVCAHRMEAGQTIRIHNDHLGDGQETHRLVVQLNRGWSVGNGGLLMLFASDDPRSVTDVILPVHRSAFGFEISDNSHHAVSTISMGSRLSIVYTFRNAR